MSSNRATSWQGWRSALDGSATVVVADALKENEEKHREDALDDGAESSGGCFA